MLFSRPPKHLAEDMAKYEQVSRWVMNVEIWHIDSESIPGSVAVAKDKLRTQEPSLSSTSTLTLLTTPC